MRGDMEREEDLHLLGTDLDQRLCRINQQDECHSESGHPDFREMHGNSGWQYFNGTNKEYPAFKWKFRSYQANYH
jgi:hypothetical protein